jgi:hypothetical protein
MDQLRPYHNSKDKTLDAIIAKRDTSKFKIAKMTTKHLSGYGNKKIEQVNHDCWRC